MSPILSPQLVSPSICILHCSIATSKRVKDCTHSDSRTVSNHGYQELKTRGSERVRERRRASKRARGEGERKRDRFGKEKNKKGRKGWRYRCTPTHFFFFSLSLFTHANSRGISLQVQVLFHRLQQVLLDPKSFESMQLTIGLHHWHCGLVQRALLQHLSPVSCSSLTQSFCLLGLILGGSVGVYFSLSLDGCLALQLHVLARNGCLLRLGDSLLLVSPLASCPSITIPDTFTTTTSR